MKTHPNVLIIGVRLGGIATAARLDTRIRQTDVSSGMVINSSSIPIFQERIKSEYELLNVPGIPPLTFLKRCITILINT